VRNFLPRAGQHLLPHQLGEQDLLGQVGMLFGRKVERTFWQERHEALDERRHALAGPGRHGEDLVCHAERFGVG